MHEHSLLERRSYWLLRDWLKHVPKKDLDYIKMRTEDAMKRLTEVIKRDWEEEAADLPCGSQIAREVSAVDDDLYTSEEWLGAVEGTGFIDYDGFGNLATATLISNIAISPSDITCFKVKLPSWATHVVWYNK